MIEDRAKATTSETKKLSGIDDNYRLGVTLHDVDRIIQSIQNESSAIHGPEGSSLKLAEAIKREYAMMCVFSEKVASAHIEGDYHIENLGDIDRPTSMIGNIDFIKQHGLKLPGGFAGSRPAKRPEVLLSHLVSYTAALQGYFSQAPAWDSVNYALAPMLVGMNQREINQLAQTLLFELSAPNTSRGGQPVRCDLHFDCEAPAYLRNLPVIASGGEKFTAVYGSMGVVAGNFMKTVLEVFLEGDSDGHPFIGPRPIIHLTRHFLENPANKPTLDLIVRAATERGGIVLAFDRPNIGAGITGRLTGDPNRKLTDACFAFASRYGVGPEKFQRAADSRLWRAAAISSVAINLPRVALKAGNNREVIFDMLTSLLETAAQASLEKRIFLEKLLAKGEAGVLAMPAMRFGKDPFLPLGWTVHSICPIGLAETAHIITGFSPDYSIESQDFALRVISHLNTEAERLSVKHNVKFLISESRDITAPHRFAMLDHKKFGLQSVYESLPTRFLNGTDDESELYYTNSARLPVNSEVGVANKLKIEGALLGGLVWNAVTDFRIGSTLPPSEITTNIITYSLNQTNIPAIAFSPEFTLCSQCRKLSRGFHSSCKHCGTNRVDGLAQSSAGYSRTSTWPKWKLAELKNRSI